jgi:ribonucleoside-diphosphate reductase alpha chain
LNLPSSRFVISDDYSSKKKAFEMAYKLGCKGITVYRYGSKKEQVLYVGSALGREESEILEYTSAEPEYSGGCLTPLCN